MKDNKGKRTFKDTIDRFEPLTKAEQKDLLFILLDSMDFYADAAEGAKTEEDAEKFAEHCSFYQFVVNFLVKDRDWMSNKDLILKGAHKDRLAWEKKKKKGEL